MDQNETLVHRRNVPKGSGGDCCLAEEKPVSADEEELDDDCRKRRLTLMEEVFLLGLKDKEGYPSFWNTSLCLGLRGSILVELSLRGRIKLEDAGLKKKSLAQRKVLVKNSAPTGESLLDEALKSIRKVDPPECVGNWISYLSGDTWNFLKRKYHMKNVRDRIAKGLAEKDVLSTDKTRFMLFDITTHPLHDATVKVQLVKKVQDAVLLNWVNDFSRMDKRLLSLLLLAQSSEVIDDAFNSLSSDDLAMATKRLGELSTIDLELESDKEYSNDVLFAVVDYLSR